MPTNQYGKGHVNTTGSWRIPAGRPRAGQLLSQAQQERYQKAGVTKRAYESGASVSAARGHGKTPEHGIKDAAKNPEKYRDYLNKRPTGGQLRPADLADLREQAANRLDAIFRNYHKYNETTVQLRIMGGETEDEKTEFPGMTERECRITINSSESELRALASRQYKGNPWWYH